MQLKDFRLLRVPVDSESPIFYEFLVKPHSTSTISQADAAQELPAHSTLFLLHVDPTITEEALHRFFGLFGPVKKVLQRRTERSGKLRKQPNASSSVVLTFIVFKEAKTVQKILGYSELLCNSHPQRHARSSALTLPRKFCLSLPQGGILVYAEKELKAFKSAEDLEEEANAFMKSFDMKKDMEKQRRKQEKRVDEDGFAPVSGSIHSADSSVASAITRSNEDEKFAALPFLQMNSTPSIKPKKKRRGGQEEDFYRFQIKAAKRADLANTRKTMLEDVQAIEKMKAEKKFHLEE
ncbi:hypothetical protein IE077_002590 [Cardiosporidium cionae]|uniref:Ribosomal RNA-processing protein 7 C-terminal domain-containing protein n=1 Tax=Cardiosporidium cionae TaxID=476202 RepID=A0ABQ7JAF9_9APIC|nr:hypothetical protein IE077_002590 [Cardiosporidium cionae]|eukprot:KAF8820985.1 hypothetical protein IE077_002590 [Cardiosporidium cionae]